MTTKEAIEQLTALKPHKDGSIVCSWTHEQEEALDMAIQALSPWIPVEERLPEETECHYKHLGPNRKVMKSEMVFTLHKDGRVIVNNTRNGKWMPSPDSPVTHWMPIPRLND